MSCSPTPRQLRALHAAARAKGLSHEDLRAAAGVASLTLLTVQQAAALLDRLNADRPQRRADIPSAPVGRTFCPPAKRTTRGAIRACTPRQQYALRARLRALGWSDATFAGFLAKRFPAVTLEALFAPRPTVTTAQASKIISGLDAVSHSSRSADGVVRSSTSHTVTSHTAGGVVRSSTSHTVTSHAATSRDTDRRAAPVTEDSACATTP